MGSCENLCQQPLRIIDQHLFQTTFRHSRSKRHTSRLILGKQVIRPMTIGINQQPRTDRQAPLHHQSVRETMATPRRYLDEFPVTRGKLRLLDAEQTGVAQHINIRTA